MVNFFKLVANVFSLFACSILPFCIGQVDQMSKSSAENPLGVLQDSTRDHVCILMSLHSEQWCWIRGIEVRGCASKHEI